MAYSVDNGKVFFETNKFFWNFEVYLKAAFK